MFFFSRLRKSDGPFRAKRKVDVLKTQNKRFGRDTLYAGNPEKVTLEVLAQNLRADPKEKHAGYVGMLGDRVREISRFLDPQAIALATNVISRDNFPEISRKISTRDDLDAISLLKISENFARFLKPEDEVKFFEKSFRKFHELLGDLTPLECIHLAKVF